MIKLIGVLVFLAVLYAATFWSLVSSGTNPFEAGLISIASPVFAFLFWPREGRQPPQG
jgi:uncharacterized protein YggT (Ycf19 family)